MELNQLSVFHTLVKKGSISTAAASLGITQPTATKYLRILEEELAVALFQRHSRGVVLTEAGRTFLPYVSAALEALEEGRQALFAQSDGHHRVSIAAPAAICAYFLPPILQRVVQEAVLDVQVRTAHSAQVIELLLDGSIDLGLTMATTSHAGLKQTLLVSDRVTAFARPGHPIRSKPVRCSHLKEYSLAVVEGWPGQEEFIESLTRMKRDTRGWIIKIAPVELAKSLVTNSDMITFVPRLVVQQELARGELAEVTLLDCPQMTWNLYLVYRNRKILPQGVTQFMDLFTPLPKVRPS